MKKFTRNAALVAMMTLMSATANAQYIKEAPAGGFDFSQGTDYVVIYAPSQQVTAMGSKILSNQNLDENMVDNQFYYWTADWNDKIFTLYNIENTQKNSWGGDDKLNMTPLWDWGSGDFSAKAKPYDLSAITDDHILHIGFMNIGAADATAQFQFSLAPSAAKGDIYQDHDYGGFKLQVNTAAGVKEGNFYGVGNAPELNKWYYLDIPVKDLVDEDGDFGLEYDFSKPINKGGKIFTCGFNGATSTEYYGKTQEAAIPLPIDPESGKYQITITKLGSAMAVDHVFLYKKSATGIQNTKTATGHEVQAIYDLTGRQINDYRSGVNIVKTANGVKKVIKK